MTETTVTVTLPSSDMVPATGAPGYVTEESV